MPNLLSLWISGNDFTGTIPDSFFVVQSGLGFFTLVADCEITYCLEGCCTMCFDASGVNCQHVAD